jgi:hypothetical protein
VNAGSNNLAKMPFCVKLENRMLLDKRPSFNCAVGIADFQCPRVFLEFHIRLSQLVCYKKTKCHLYIYMDSYVTVFFLRQLGMWRIRW